MKRTRAGLAVLLLIVISCGEEGDQEDAARWYKPWFVQVEESLTDLDLLDDDEGQADPTEEPLVFEDDEIAAADESASAPVESEPAEPLEPAGEAREVTIEVKRGETMPLYSKWSGLSMEVLSKANDGKRGLRARQAYQMTMTPGQFRRFEEARTTYHLDKEKEFFTRYEVSRLERYKVIRGDNVWRIAKLHDKLPVWVLERFNSNVNMARLKIGEELIVPVLAEIAPAGSSAAKQLWASADDAKDKAPEAVLATKKTAKQKDKRTSSEPQKGVVVRVSKKETMGHYAKWARIKVSKLLEANPGIKPNLLRLGQKVRVPVSDKRLARFYTARRKFNGTPPPADMPSMVVKKQVAPVAQPAPRAPAPDKVPPAPVIAKAKKKKKKVIRHKVSAGESAWKIAVKRYGISLGELRLANPEKDLSRLRVGDVLHIPVKPSKPGGSGAVKTP